MPSLAKQLRNDLSRVTLAARTAAEAACTAALENLAVHEKDYRGHMSMDQRQLRNRLRARGRALGDRADTAKGTQEMTRLIEDAAYEHWPISARKAPASISPSPSTTKSPCASCSIPCPARFLPPAIR